MKKFLSWLCLSLLTAFLVCDPQAGVVSYKLELNGVPDTISYLAESDGSAKINIDGYTAGNYTFRLKAIGQGDWPSDWSLPFDATKPLRSGNVSIINE